LHHDAIPFFEVSIVTGVTGVLLAAGASSRFGSHKLLAQLNNNPLIQHSAAALGPCDRIVAVVREADAALQTRLRDLDIECVVNTEPARGMGFSIACAVQATANSRAWLLLPADMPYVSTATTQKVVQALREGAALAAPFYQGQRGHPVGFSVRFYEALAGLDGDVGARQILEQHRDQLRLIHTGDAGVLLDVDIPSDLGSVPASVLDQ
jgi:molybdenum cofactor cytidylyltransferase